jgi:hypothetical protein
MDISQAKIQYFVTHFVGNKLREEGLLLSSNPSKTEGAVASIILKRYLGGLKSTDIYNFFHESDIKLNEIRVFAADAFENEQGFMAASIKIAKHLYSKSTHPSVPGGDLFIALFTNILLNNVTTNALGIFKAESKEDFLSIYKENDSFNLRGNVGIDPRDLQKAAIILGGENTIFAFERNSPTSYWLQEFLKVEKVATPKSAASYIGRLVKETIRDIAEPDAIALYQKKISNALAVESPTIQSINEVSSEFIGAERTQKASNVAAAAVGISLEPSYVLEQKATTRATSNAFRRVPLAGGIDLVIGSQANAKLIKVARSDDRRLITITIEMDEIK